MKKPLILSLSLLFCSVFYASAQSFMKGEVSVNAGVGLGVLMNELSGVYTYSPPLSVSAEYSITDHIGLGAYAGFMTRNYSVGKEQSRLTAYSYGAKGSFHFSYFINEFFNAGIDEERLDLYASFYLGMENLKWSNQRVSVIGSESGRNWVYGPVAGARFFITDKIGVFGELGRGVHGTVTLGVTGRL